MPAARAPLTTARARLFVALAVLVALLPVGGGVWVWDGVATVRVAEESRRWPVVPGTVLSAERDASWSPAPIGMSRDPHRWRRDRLTFNTTVLVQYRVGGAVHTTRTRTFGQVLGSGDGSESELVRRRYPVGATVPVHVAPDDPTLAVLEPGFSSEALALPLVGFAINLVVVIVALFVGISIADRPWMRVPVTLFGLCFQLAGLGLLAWLVPQVVRGVRAASWPTVPGRIVYGAPLDTTGTGRVPADSLELLGGSDPTRVVFRYSISDSVRYARSTVRSPDAGPARDGGAAPWPFGLGQPVAVHVDPTDASNAVVDPGLHARHGWTLGLVLALLGFGWLAQRVVARQIDQVAPTARPTGSR